MCVSTVIDYLDVSIEGGFVVGSAILVSCRSGGGKTIRSEQFIRDIAIHNDIGDVKRG
jgi:KaiC/GvpD/RAD55 family RecA-like ATPase